ncbi:MAG TPA: hypothetical protein VMV83_17425 [Rectinemataceae bacterium]|nr:hypothetical protein [Rectinemataceae bacterium]
MRRPKEGVSRSFPESLILRTEIVAAEAEISPLDIANATASGRWEIPAPEDGVAGLLVGGVTIAKGRIVSRGGRHYLKVLQVFEKHVGEAQS